MQLLINSLYNNMIFSVFLYLNFIFCMTLTIIKLCLNQSFIILKLSFKSLKKSLKKHFLLLFCVKIMFKYSIYEVVMKCLIQ